MYESNLFRSDIPDSVRDLGPETQKFLADQHASLRQFAERSQFGALVLPESILYEIVTLDLFPLGVIAGFETSDGLVRARLMKLGDTTKLRDQARFVYVNDTLTVEDDGLSYQFAGYLPASTENVESVYGWVIFEGVLPFDTGLATGELIEFVHGDGYLPTRFVHAKSLQGGYTELIWPMWQVSSTDVANAQLTQLQTSIAQLQADLSAEIARGDLTEDALNQYKNSISISLSRFESAIAHIDIDGVTVEMGLLRDSLIDATNQMNLRVQTNETLKIAMDDLYQAVLTSQSLVQSYAYDASRYTRVAMSVMGTAQESAANSAESALASFTSAGEALTYRDEAGLHAAAALTSETNAAVSAGSASSSASTATTQASNASASAASASASATLAASVGPGAINANPLFQNYPTTPGRPTDWTAWSNGGSGNPTRVTGELPGSYAVQDSATAGNNQGDMQLGTYGLGNVQANQYFVIEADVQLVSGTLQGAGVHINFYDNGGNAYGTSLGGNGISFYADADNTGAVIGAGTVGKTYRFRKLMRAAANAAIDRAYFYRMTGWTGWGTVTVKTLKWFRCSLRPATQAEIDAGVALPSLSATVSSHSSTIATHTSQIATHTTDISAANASISSEATARAAADGAINAQYGVRVSAGKVTGFQLISGANQSDFIIQADKFQVESGGQVPFQVISGTTYLKNAMIQAQAIDATKVVTSGLITNSAQINNGLITNAKIGNLEVDSAKIANLTVGNIKIADDAISGGGGGIETSVAAYGNGTFQTLISYTFTLASTAKIAFMVSLAQGYLSGSPQWLAYVYLDGVAITSRGGTEKNDAPSLAVYRGSVSAGSHTVELRWYGANSGIVCNAGTTLVVFPLMK